MTYVGVHKWMSLVTSNNTMTFIVMKNSLLNSNLDVV